MLSDHAFHDFSVYFCITKQDLLKFLFNSKSSYMNRSSHQRCSIEKVFLKHSQNSQENTCASLFLRKLQASGLRPIKKETLAHVFSCEFCEIFKNTFFTEHLRTLLHEGKLIAFKISLVHFEFPFSFLIIGHFPVNFVIMT